MNKDQIWKSVLGEMEVTLSRAHFVTWFKDTFISSIENDKIILCVPNAFVKKWLEEKYNKNIISALQNVTKLKINDIIYKIELRKDSELLVKEKENKADIFTVKDQPKMTAKPIGNKHGLNPKYTLDSFVVGRGNELAHAACLAVIKNLGKSYNPLFIYGGVGLGKTHLMQAVGNAVTAYTNKVLYTTSEKFTNSYIQAVTSGKAKEFKNLYRNVDLLLVDDIQFMGGKDGTQEEFFHTFNELQQNDKQIILTSDRPPKSIPAIEKRLISRFESGMVADIGKPDIETKFIILEKKAQEKNFTLDKDVLTYIVNNIKNNIRELEGALNKVIAYHQLKNIEPTVDTVKEVLSDFISDIQERSMSPQDIINIVSHFYNINAKDLISSSRKKELVTPRQISIYLIREELGSSYPAIGNELGGRDHTTAMHAYNKISKEIKELNNERLKQEINSIKQLFNQSF